MAAKLLLVDDDDTTRNALARCLRQEGFDVVTANDGNEAVKRLSIESFDVVLSDFAMPGMDGLNLTKHVSRIAPQTPVIIMSGSATINREDVLNAGGFDLIEKPMVLNSLIGKIELAFATGAPHNGSRSAFEQRHFIG